MKHGTYSYATGLMYGKKVFQKKWSRLINRYQESIQPTFIRKRFQGILKKILILSDQATCSLPETKNQV